MMQNPILKHKREWDELETLVTRARKSISRLTPTELSRLDVLYRRTSAHLAQVTTRTTDQGLIQYLNDLTASAHSIIYLPPRRSIGTAIPVFFGETFPRCVARLWRYHLAAAALMLLGMLIAYLAVAGDIAAAYAILPAGEIRQPGASREQLLEVLRHGRDQGHGKKFAFASFLFGHNLKVAILAMATGILAAVPTVILTVYNGMILGAFSAVHHRAGITTEMWAWILPHGITELGAIILCGGVGLRIGRAVLSPGLQTRGESLRIAGEEAARTVCGAAVMLIAAAVIESYLRQSHLGEGARLGFAGATLIFWILYFWHGRRMELNT